MDTKKTARAIFENGGVEISINTLYDLLHGNRDTETIKKSDIRDLIEELEEYES